MEQDVILSRLLDKFENSKHLSDPGSSNRRVMLRVDKKELPEYQRENAAIRDRFNRAAMELEREGLIHLEWISGQTIFSKVILELARVERAYNKIGRLHPQKAAQDAYAQIQTALPYANTIWIRAWRDEVCQTLRAEWRLPAVCKKGAGFLHDFLRVLACYDHLNGESVTMRAFSIRCFQDSKRFERAFQEDFLRIAEGYDQELHALCAQREMSSRDKLACLGIYAHPEFYQMSGRCSIVMESGTVNLEPLCPAGMGIPSTAVEKIRSFSLEKIRRITFLENKTNYEEYLLSELAPDELAVYHGGFLSPQKRLLLRKLADCLPGDTEVFFWADIDLGGFAMFAKLQEIFPRLRPMRMGGREVEQYAELGLKRTDSYLSALRNALDADEFPAFREAIKAILAYGVTIEQETFLSKLDQDSVTRIREAGLAHDPPEGDI